MSSVQPIAVYSEFRGQLAELKQHNESVVFDYEDPAGNKEARSHIYKLRKTKGAVDAARKAEKAASLEYGRQVDAQAKEIVAEIDGMIDVHQRPLDEIEAREKLRQAKHEASIARMLELSLESNEDLSAAVLKQRLADLESYKLGEHWEEFEIEAARVKDGGINRLKAQIERRERYETEQAELARLRREHQAREQAERDARIAAEATHRAELAAKAQAETERQAAERRELQLILEKEQAERRAEQAAAQAECDARAAAVREKVLAEKREANKRHATGVKRKAAAEFVAGGLTQEAAELAVELIAAGKIPRISVTY